LRIKLSEIQEGCILAADVFSKTNLPIIPKKTVITNMQINVLEAFNIEEVEIERVLVNGVPFQVIEIETEETDANVIIDQLGFVGLFLKSVTKFKKEFHSWQSGLPVDIANIRVYYCPCLKKSNPIRMRSLICIAILQKIHTFISIQ
jgi:hypothetical protein